MPTVWRSCETTLTIMLFSCVLPPKNYLETFFLRPPPPPFSPVCFMSFGFLCFQRLDLAKVDAANEMAADTVMKRYMEPADLGPGIDPKVPRFIVPSHGCEFVYTNL